MNGAHWHLLVNHFPVVLQAVALPIAVYGAARKEVAVQQVGLGLLVLAGLFTVASYMTGGPAAEVLDGTPGLDKELIHTHALAAQWALISALIVGVLSAVLFARNRMGHAPSRGLWLAHALVALWGLSVVVTTSHHGGGVRHPEIQAAK